jgi:hypothetical protein
MVIAQREIIPNDSLRNRLQTGKWSCGAGVLIIMERTYTEDKQGERSWLINS